MTDSASQRSGSLNSDNPDSSPAFHESNPERLWIRAYSTPEDPLPIVPAPADRSWMDETKQAFANRCLPLRIANQAGWFILNAHHLEVCWDGGPDPSATKVVCKSGPPSGCPASHFGHGIVTWRIPYLFRTPPGFNLIVRGPTNWFKDAVAPLDGIVETDWAVATFTMNWKITRPNAIIHFEPGDPICMIIPQPRGQLEQFFPEMSNLESEPDLENAYNQWATSRAEFLMKLHDLDPEATELRWQKHYFKGNSPSGVSASQFQHQVKLRLRAFSLDWPHRWQFPSQQQVANGANKEPSGMTQDTVLGRREVKGEDTVVDINDGCLLSDGYVTVRDFFPPASAMRSEFEAHFSDPYGRYGMSQEVWDYWYVPDMYTYLRADPNRVFSPDLVDYFLEALSTWSLNTLGLGKVSRPYLSLYVNGCGQGLHNDSSNGRFGYVFSLTEWSSRHFLGGETLILREAPYWKSPRIATSGAGTEFYDLIPSIFNQLLVFDDRIIHAVRAIQGNMDPRDGRLVLHGHISESGITAAGALGQEQVEVVLASRAPEILSDVESLNDHQGFLTLRIGVEPNGTITTAKILCNRILAISSSARDPGGIVLEIVKRLTRIKFPASSGPTAVTVPIILSGDQDATA